MSASHGAIDLEVPAGSHIALQASADHGDVTADVPGLAVTQAGAGKLTASAGGGGHAVVLTTTHGDVRLRATSAVAQKTP